MTRLSILLAAAVMLAACTEKSQTTSARKADDKPWAMAASPYSAADYKSGDQASWEQQLKGRAQAQNEYSRTAAP